MVSRSHPEQHFEPFGGGDCDIFGSCRAIECEPICGFCPALKSPRFRAAGGGGFRTPRESVHRLARDRFYVCLLYTSLINKGKTETKDGKEVKMPGTPEISGEQLDGLVLFVRKLAVKK